MQCAMKRLMVLLLGWVLVLVARAERPNIVIIFCDDLGYGDIGCFGAQGWETPHIDRIASQGVKLTDFHVAQAVCSASRVALMTGCYSNRVGITGALGPGTKHGLNAEETTIAEICTAAGYATAAYGKWHLGHRTQFLPTHHGFDEFFGIPYSNDMWPWHPGVRHLPEEERVKRWPHLPLFEGDQIIDAKVEPRDQTDLTKRITERAVRFIRKNKEKPFFLYVAHPQPHVPLFVSDERRGKSENGLLGDVLQEIDWSTGEILKTLDEAGLTENTWVMFTSDNGPWMVYGNHAGGVGPLRGCKGNSWEGGVRVPCVMKWPKKLKAGTVVDVPLMTIDILPTIAKVLGQPLPQRPIDGKDAWTVISGVSQEPVQEAYFFYYGRNNLEAMRMGKWKLVFPHRWRDSKTEPGGDGLPGKYHWRQTGLELYDLEQDIGEAHDVAKSHSEVVREMQALAEKMRKELGDELKKRSKGEGTREPGRVR